MRFYRKNLCDDKDLMNLMQRHLQTLTQRILIILFIHFFTILNVYAATPIAHYTFDDLDWVTNGQAINTLGGSAASINGTISRLNSDDSLGHASTCAAASFLGGSLDIFGLPVSTNNTDKTSVSFWMYWDGTNSVMPMGWVYHDLWLVSGRFGFNTANSDIYGINASGLANGWHHVAAVFTNGSVTNNELYIDGIKQALSQQRSSPNTSRAYVNSRMRIGGWHGDNSYRFSGAIDEFKIYNGALTQAEVNADLSYTSPEACVNPEPQEEELIASYDFNGDWSSSIPIEDQTGDTQGIITGAISRQLTPASGSKPETCAGAQFDGGAIDINDLPVSTTAGDKTSISFWMNWNGTNSVMPLGWNYHDIWIYNGSFGFNTAGGDIYGISSTGLANTWHHVTVVFTNNNALDNKIYLNGVEQTLSRQRGQTNQSRAIVDPHLRLGGWWGNNSYRFKGQLDELKIYNGEITQETIDQNRTASSPCAPPIQYHFDEASWTGTAEEVIDSGTKEYHGTALNGANTAQSNPVVSGSLGTCRYAHFNGDNDYIAVPDIESLNKDFTITAWIRSEKSTPGRIFADDDNNSGGFAFSLNDPGSGKLRFFSRNVRPISLDTSSRVIPQDGNWYFVSAVHDEANKTRSIYVNGHLKASGTYTGTWGTDSGITTIGSESDRSREGVKFAPFQGDIDELTVYSTHLSQSEIQTAMNEVHSCSNTPSLDHFEIHYPTTGLTCQPSSITINACANADCSSLITDDVTVTLSPSTGWLSNIVTIENGQATFSLNTPIAKTLPILITDSSLAAANDSTCFANNIADPSCSMTISEVGFTFDIPTLTACKPSDNITIRAVKQGSNTTQCVSALVGNQTLSFGAEYSQPSTGQKQVSINGKNINTLTPDTDINLTFDSDGEAQFTAQYDDAGELQLTVNYDNGSGSIVTGSGTLTSIPVALVSYSDDNNASCQQEDVSCSIFKKAGEPFDLSVKAACWTDDNDTDFTDNPSTPNFALTGIGIQPQVIAPTNGNNGLLSQPSINMTVDDKGIHTVQQTISEVGVFLFNLTTPPYFGETLNLISSSAIGRFIPDHFETTTVSDGTFAPNFCGYRYSGEPFTYATQPQLTITAYNAATPSTITRNYQDEFAKLTESDFSLTPPTEDAAQLGADKAHYVALDWQADNVSLVDNHNGSLSLTLGQDVYVYLKQSNSQIAPFSNKVNLNFTRIKDSDNVAASTLPHTLEPSGQQIRFGRIAIDSIHGSELPPLSLNIKTEQYNGYQWVHNTADNCTTLTLNNDFRLSSPTTSNGTLQTGATNMTIHNGQSSANFTPINAGTAVMTFSAPGEENQGHIDITSHIATTQAWLLNDSDNNGVYDNEARGRASFGLFKGSRHILFRREQY